MRRYPRRRECVSAMDPHEGTHPPTFVSQPAPLFVLLRRRLFLRLFASTSTPTCTRARASRVSPRSHLRYERARERERGAGERARPLDGDYRRSWTAQWPRLCHRTMTGSPCRVANGYAVVIIIIKSGGTAVRVGRDEFPATARSEVITSSPSGTDLRQQYNANAAGGLSTLRQSDANTIVLPANLPLPRRRLRFPLLLYTDDRSSDDEIGAGDIVAGFVDEHVSSLFPLPSSP